jgi:enoyl-CoA hydratase/carnithine racemase
VSADHIRFALDDDGVATITIDRPEKRNAMTWAMLGEFNAAVAVLSAEPRARVVILTGAPGVFCAGTDLADLANTPADRRGGSGDRDDGTPPWPLQRCPKPVIAAIDGPAVGMGAELATQCDIRILSPRARIAWNFGLRGLVPDTGAGSWLLPRLIGPQRALRLLFSAEALEAQEALAIGFAAQVVAPEDLAEAARTEAHRYLKCSPFALARIKALIWEGLGGELASHMRRHHAALAECFASDDHKEGVASFLERRPPQFTGR